MEHTANQIVLRGTLAELPQVSHENHNRIFYRFPLEVERLSGVTDILPILVPEDVLNAMDISGGSMLEVSGQIRSFNSRNTDGRKLVISVYADKMDSCEGSPENHVELNGVICKEPVYRRTPLGREICDIMLAVNRPYRRADYIPCIFWGRTAQNISICEVGDTVQLIGRLQSRSYVKVLEENTETRTAYEVSAMSAEVL